MRNDDGQRLMLTTRRPCSQGQHARATRGLAHKSAAPPRKRRFRIREQRARARLLIRWVLRLLNLDWLPVHNHQRHALGNKRPIFPPEEKHRDLFGRPRWVSRLSQQWQRHQFTQGSQRQWRSLALSFLRKKSLIAGGGRMRLYALKQHRSGREHRRRSVWAESESCGTVFRSLAHHFSPKMNDGTRCAPLRRARRMNPAARQPPQADRVSTRLYQALCCAQWRDLWAPATKPFLSFRMIVVTVESGSVRKISLLRTETPRRGRRTKSSHQYGRDVTMFPSVCSVCVRLR